MSSRRLILVLLALALCAMPATALAAGRKGYKVYEPPGKAGASEYAEVVPTASGGTKPPATLSGAAPANLDALGSGKSTARKLEKLGPSGIDAANWARATAPSLIGASTNAAGKHLTLGSPPTLDRGSAASGLFDLLSGSDAGGIGLVLPLLLSLTLAAAAGYLIARRSGPARR